MIHYLKTLWPSLRRRATGIANDPKRREALFNFTYKKLPYLLINTEIARSVIDDSKTFIRMLQAFFRRKYTKISYHTVIMIISAFMYFVMPMDLLPDWIPSGLLDDAVVLGWLANTLKDDIYRFQLWEENENRSDEDEFPTSSA